MNAPYNVKSRVLGAFRHLLVPLVRVLLRNGVGFHEFAQVAKEVYVKVCVREFLPSGQSEGTHARVAILTGLNRSDVGTLLVTDSDSRRELDSTADRIASLLQGWHTDADFVGPYGVPRDLFLESDPSGLRTLRELVGRYGGGASVESALKELGGIGATVVPDAGEPIRVVKRTYIKETMAPDAVEVFARGVRRYAETVDHNLENTEPDDRLFERWVFPDDGIRECDWGVFQALVSERLQELVRELDTKFAWFEAPQNRGEEGVPVGVGLYVYRDSKDDQKDWEQMLGRSSAQ